MDLLDKFDAVTVKADARITPDDKAYCEAHQAAYDAAIQSFQELAFFWEDMESTQRNCWAVRTLPISLPATALTSPGGRSTHTWNICTNRSSTTSSTISIPPIMYQSLPTMRLTICFHKSQIFESMKIKRPMMHTTKNCAQQKSAMRMWWIRSSSCWMGAALPSRRSMNWRENATKRHGTCTGIERNMSERKP